MIQIINLLQSQSKLAGFRRIPICCCYWFNRVLHLHLGILNLTCCGRLPEPYIYGYKCQASVVVPVS